MSTNKRCNVSTQAKNRVRDCKAGVIMEHKMPANSKASTAQLYILVLYGLFAYTAQSVSTPRSLYIYT